MKDFCLQVAPTKWEGQDFVRVVIHIRRRDYTNKAHTREGWTQPSMDYFRRARSYFTDCLERVQFVIMSDGIEWCREHLSWPNAVFSVGHSAAVDLAIASLCDHAIVTIGSYSWWAAWFTNGVVITNKEVPRPRSVLSRRIHREDYYKPDWIAL